MMYQRPSNSHSTVTPIALNNCNSTYHACTCNYVARAMGAELLHGVHWLQECMFAWGRGAIHKIMNLGTLTCFGSYILTILGSAWRYIIIGMHYEYNF